MTRDEFTIHTIATDNGCKVRIVPADADPVTYNPHLVAHAQTVHEREAEQADGRFMTVEALQERAG